MSDTTLSEHPLAQPATVKQSSGRKALRAATTKPDPTKPIALASVTCSYPVNSENGSHSIAVNQSYANSVGISGLVTAIEQHPGGLVIATVRVGGKWNNADAGYDKFVVLYGDTIGEVL